MKHYSTPEELLKEMAIIYKIPVSLLKDITREKHIVKIRHYFCFIASKYYRFQLTKIAAAINRDHTTIIHGRDVVAQQLEINDIRTLQDISMVKAVLDIKDDLHLDYRNLLELNKQLLSRLKDLRKEVILLSHDNLKLKNELNYHKQLCKAI